MKAILGVLILSTGVFAMDPPYPTSQVEGFFMRGLDEPYKLTFDPGTLENCKDNPQPHYTFYNCEVKGAEVNVDNGTKKHKFIFTSMNAQEMAGTGGFPATMSYYFNGKFGTTLPDGTTYETDASFSFNRKLSDPDKLPGNLNVYALGVNAGIMMKWPGGATAPSPSPAPSPTPGPTPSLLR
jgi:hypothetical protein